MWNIVSDKSVIFREAACRNGRLAAHLPLFFINRNYIFCLSYAGARLLTPFSPVVAVFYFYTCFVVFALR